MTDALHTPLDNEWLSARDAAKAVHTSRRRIYRAVRTKQLSAAVINDRGEFRIHVDWLREWLSKLAGRA